MKKSDSFEKRKRRQDEPKLPKIYEKFSEL